MGGGQRARVLPSSGKENSSPCLGRAAARVGIYGHRKTTEQQQQSKALQLVARCFCCSCCACRHQPLQGGRQVTGTELGEVVGTGQEKDSLHKATLPGMLGQFVQWGC